MNIRTITYFCETGFPIKTEELSAAGQALAELKIAFTEAGYSVQTTRLAGPPFATPLAGQAEKVVSYAQALEDAAFINDIDYATLGPARPEDAPEFFRAIPEAIAATQNIFASAIIASPTSGLNVAAARLAAEIIQRCGATTPDGFGNLRFAALANVPPGVPFLPAAYHSGGAPAVALGIESADLAVRACNEASALEEARAQMVSETEAHAARLTEIMKKTCGRRGLNFLGLDFAYAVYPDEARSLGVALERLTGGKVGEHGTLAAAAFLTEALDRAQFKRVGFNGLFLPVFEDAVLAQRAAEGTFTVNDLLLYSAVCGTGLDTIPVPGDVSVEALTAVLLDVAALAVRLNKPLTARLMPIPSKQAGDEVKFDFEFFAPSRVLPLKSSGLGGLLGGATAFELLARG